jgi:hypothetical protein
MVAAVAGGRARREPALNEQPQLALNSRVTIEQAKGVLAQYGGLELAAAFDELRHYARSHNVKLADLATGSSTRMSTSPRSSQLDNRRTHRSNHALDTAPCTVGNRTQTRL